MGRADCGPLVARRRSDGTWLATVEVDTSHDVEVHPSSSIHAYELDRTGRILSVHRSDVQ